MRLWRFEFGLWRTPLRRRFRDCFMLDANDCPAGCIVLMIGPFYLTWLAGDCYRKFNEPQD